MLFFSELGTSTRVRIKNYHVIPMHTMRHYTNLIFFLRLLEETELMGRDEKSKALHMASCLEERHGKMKIMWLLADTVYGDAYDANIITT